MGMFFSFIYEGKPFHLEAAGSYTIDETLTVRVEKQSYPAFRSAAGEAQSYTLWWENPADRDSGLLEEIRDCDTLLPILGKPLGRGVQPTDDQSFLEYWNGPTDPVHYFDDDVGSAREFACQKAYLCLRRERRLASYGGRSSDRVMPFFHLHGQDAAGNAGGAFVAIGWTGDWQVVFTNRPEEAQQPGIRVQTGLQRTRFRLHAGEKLRTTGVLVLPYLEQEGDTDGYNRFRRLMQTHFDHRTAHPAQPEAIFAVEMWGGLPEEEIARRIDRLQAHGVPFDQLWMDAAWYGDCENSDTCFGSEWAQFTGDWRINPHIHPTGLQSVHAALEKQGQRLMLWAEPERVTDYVLAHSDFYRENPELVIRGDNPLYNLLNLGEPRAVDYIFGELCRLIDALHIGCYRQDFNMEPAAFFAGQDAPDRQGVTEIKHIMGLYRLWDRLQERYPDLLIDNCASGGRRIDFETTRRAIPFFRSDYQCSFTATPEVEQVHNTGISRILPCTGCTTKVKGDTYTVRSAYAASFGLACYNAVFQTMDEADFAWAAAVCREYRQIQPYFRKDFYNLASAVYDDTAWAVWQYHDPADGSGVILAFRRGASPYESVPLHPQRLAGAVRLEPMDTNGSAAYADGTLCITLPHPRSSTVLRYYPVKSR